MAARRRETHELVVDGRTVVITSPRKVYFPEAGLTKLDVVEYYRRVGPGALRGVRDRPMALKRFVEGISKPAFFQKRAPPSRPDWIETATLSFPSGRTAEEIVVRDLASLLWVVNLGCIDLNPHPTRFADLEHPDELRIDLDPVAGVPFTQICRVAMITREVLADHGLESFPKTSGSRGMHVYARIRPAWSFSEVRHAALAVAREVERRAPELATSKWWKEERHGVFLDYNQNAKDRTVASAYSLRPLPDARVSTPLDWDEVPDCDPAQFTLATVAARFEAIGDPSESIDDKLGELAPLLELFETQRGAGQVDAPWPPHYQKAEGEPDRVAPSRARRGRAAAKEAASQGTAAKAPVLVIAKAKDKDAALAGLARWKERYPEVAAHLGPEDVLVDSMRGRSSTWTRVRIHLKRVPEAMHPPEEPPDPDYDPRVEWRGRRGRSQDKGSDP